MKSLVEVLLRTQLARPACILFPTGAPAAVVVPRAAIYYEVGSSACISGGELFERQGSTKWRLGLGLGLGEMAGDMCTGV